MSSARRAGDDGRQDRRRAEREQPSFAHVILLQKNLRPDSGFESRLSHGAVATVNEPVIEAWR
jgi:hypothetical protein